jgi:hypothetical protein
VFGCNDVLNRFDSISRTLYARTRNSTALALCSVPHYDNHFYPGVSRRTTGFSGAALSNLMNEAAIFAARQNRTTISAENVADALDRILMGPEKKGGGGVSRRIRELVAYHEAGHALVGKPTLHPTFYRPTLLFMSTDRPSCSCLQTDLLVHVTMWVMPW